MQGIAARILAVAVVVVSVATWPAAYAAQQGPGGARVEAGAPAAERPDMLQQIRFDQKLNAVVPGDLLFRDESGRAVQLREYFGSKPVILALVYYECPMLCSQVLSGLTSALDVVSFNVGTDFDVVAVSFNPKEGPGLAAAKKRSYVERYGRPGTEGGWHFLTGPQESIAQLTDAVGFKYAWDEETKQYAHAAGVIVLTPDGRVSKYFYGIEYSARDLKFGLMQASERKIGTPVDNLLLYCYHYDPATGKYGVATMTAVRLGGAVTVVGMLAFWTAMWRQGRRSPDGGRAA